MYSVRNRFKITERTITRNAVLNFGGHAISLIIGIATVPLIVKDLGTDRFGIISLAWVILGYFTVFDFGFGRAMTKYVAEALNKSEERQISRLAWTTLTAQVILGSMGSIVLSPIIPLLTGYFLNMPRELLAEANTTFTVLLISIPIVLVSSSLSGLLEAAQRFDLLNLIRIPTNASTFLMPLIGLLFGFKLPGIITLILISRILSLFAYFMLVIRLFPNIKKFCLSYGIFRSLLSYGGWVTLSSFLSPILVYIDRFLVASILSTAAVAYYTAPYEAVTRLWIIPLSLAMTLFPAFSAIQGNQNSERVGNYFVRALKYVLISLGPIVLILILFSKNILQLWLGNDFALNSSVPLQILAIGVLINSLAQMPYILLQAIGRPDIPAKFHLLELPIHLIIAWIFINRWGITGAALAWTTRITLDAFLLFIVTFKVFRFPPCLFMNNGLAIKSLKVKIGTGHKIL